MSDIPATFFSGPINKKRRRADLQAISAALGLPTDGKNETLADAIAAHIKQNEKVLSTDPRFQQLYKYGKGAASKTSSDVRKNSADKAAEDAVEQAKKIFPSCQCP